MSRRHSVHCLPFNEWPEGDRAAWELGCTPGDPFDDALHYGAGLRPASIAKTRNGYSRWLTFLADQGWLDPAAPPLARVIEPRLWEYFQALRAAGNAPFTIIGRFAELRMALKILAPGVDVSWVVRPGGRSVYARLRKTRKHKQVPDSRVLFKWALGIMDTADVAATPYERCRDFRDGLLLAILASRARRLRAMHGVSVGRQLVWRGGMFRIELEADLVKTKRPDAFDLPERLIRYLRRYLDEIRPALLRGRVDDALWINQRGTRLTAKAIGHIVHNRSNARFGQGFHPHTFRHALATTAALHCPEHPGLAAAVLGISTGIVEQHYNRAGQIQASRRLTALVERRDRGMVAGRHGSLPAGKPTPDSSTAARCRQSSKKTSTRPSGLVAKR